jgi:hypothetical protein
MHPDEAAKPSPTTDDYIDRENMMIEYNSNVMFGDQEYASFILLDFNESIIFVISNSDI